jgi:hypothetical protein
VSDSNWPLLYVRGNKTTPNDVDVDWHVEDDILHVNASTEDARAYRLVPVEQAWVEVQR